MSNQQQQSTQVVESKHKKRSRIISTIIVASIVTCAIATAQILSNDNLIPSIWAIISNSVFGALGVIFAFFALIPLLFSAKDQDVATKPPVSFSFQKADTIAINIPTSVDRTEPIFLQAPTGQFPMLLTSSPSFQGIVGTPPPTNIRTIQQREKIVENIFSMLTKPDITAIVLTGIGGVGKSTLAALVFEFAKWQSRTGNGVLKGEAIWLAVEANSTFVDVAGNLFKALDKPMPDFNHLTPQNQATELCTALNTANNPRLIILDQFENLLDWQTGFALSDRPGIGEWLDALNSQPCHCRILLTSRPTPRGTRDFPPTYIREYVVEGMDMQEGVELLRKQGVEKAQATDTELGSAVTRCDGHALSLELLASILRRNRSLRLTTLLDDLTYTQKWKEDIALYLLDYIYTQQLNDGQRKWLVAFALYRLPVPLEAAQVVISSNEENTPDPENKSQALSIVSVLLAQHLLQNSGSGSELYQLHAIVSEYARDHINTESVQANRKALRTLHAKAANYYISCAETSYIQRNQRKGIDDVKFLIEAVWHYCQAGFWQKAYSLMSEEDLFNELSLWGNNAVLLELCQLLLPSREWRPERTDEVFLYVTLGGLCDALETREKSFEYYKRALKVQREINEREGEGKTLHTIGMIFLKRGHLAYGFACIRLALYIFETLKSISNRDNEKRILEELRSAIGNEEYQTLIITIEPQAYQVVEQALRDGL